MFMNKISVSQTWLSLQQPVTTESIPQFTRVVANRMPYTTILSICATSLQPHTKREKVLGRYSFFVSLLGTCFPSIH